MLNNLPHFVQIASDGVPEFFLDHTLLSSLRMCEARFDLDHIKNYRSKETPWALDFGKLVHDCMEFYYKKELAGSKPEYREMFEFGAKLWRDRNYDKYINTPQFKAVGGMPGFIALLGQYLHFYQGQDRLKPIGLEIAFGKNKEVPLLDNHLAYKFAPFRLYLSGRMDFIFDDGRKIGPLDHKTFSIEGKNPMTGYEIQEGMTGYIYAMHYLVKQLKEQNPDIDLNRETNVLWLNFILTKPCTDLNKKFQRIPLYKTQPQLEDWRLRQISTASKLYSLLFQERPPDYNAHVCTNYWHSVCPYQRVHRLARKEDQEFILKTDFVAEIWNPETVESVKI